MRRLCCAVVLAILASTAAQARRAYPSRPITIIVPTPAGGATDAIARVLAERMRTSLGQPVLVENVAGASGTLGTGRTVALGAGRLHDL